MKKLMILFMLNWSFLGQAHPVKGHLDMQVHLTTQMLYSALVGKKTPLDSLPKKTMSHKHRCTQAAYEEQLWNSSTKLYIVTALDHFFSPSRRNMRETIKEQFAFIKKIVKKFPHRYAIARSPREARDIIHSGRKAFVLAIEGGTKLLRSQKDADDLARLGVSMIGIIHLKDNEYGSATIQKEARFLNLGALFSKWFGCRKKGLSRLGKKAVKWLARAGILTDISHMDSASVADTLKIAESMNIPVVATHIKLKSLTGDKNDLTDSVVRRIYNLGGMVGLTSGNPSPLRKGYRDFIPKNYCPGSYQELGIQASHLERLFHGQKDLVLGFATDMNGMVDHYRPKYGKDGCFQKKAKLGEFNFYENRRFDSFDIYGLNHIGAVKGIWKNLERDHFKTDSFMRSAEGFLKVWEKILRK